MDRLRITTALESALGTRAYPWSLCLVGEDAERKLQDLVADLTRCVSTTGDGKRIASGFAYRGIEPTFAWAHSCTDPLYPVMKEVSSPSLPDGKKFNPTSPRNALIMFASVLARGKRTRR